MRVEIHHRGKLLHSFESKEDIKAEMIDVYCIYPSKIHLHIEAMRYTAELEDEVKPIKTGEEPEEKANKPKNNTRKKLVYDKPRAKIPQKEVVTFVRPKAEYSNRHSYEDY